MSACAKAAAVGGKPTHLIRLPVVLARTGKSRSALYREVAAGTFPRGVRIGDNAVAWVEAEVADWIAARIAVRDKEVA